MLSLKISKVLVPILFILQLKLSVETMDSKALSSAVAKFSAKFCNELAKNKSVVSSPLSAEFVLALLTLGSTDDVHTELLKALDIPDDDSIRASFSAVSSQLKSLKGVTLNVANKVYIKDGSYDLNPQLKDDAIKVFDAELEKINFDNGATAAGTINKWVESKTNSRIKDLLTPDSVDPDTRLVLVNALYFKGTWKNQFNPLFTRERPFYLDETNTVNVPMMYKEDQYYYGMSEKLNAQLLKISYVGDESSMLIVLPREVAGLDAVLQQLADGHDLLADVDRMFGTKVQVTLPKFKIETEIDLAELLPKLGISSIFNPQNRGLRSLLNVQEPLFVSKAVQKAFIEVNEEGAEAAAATAIGIAFCSAMVDFTPVQTFLADRPFFVVILVNGTPFFYAANRDGE